MKLVDYEQSTQSGSSKEESEFSCVSSAVRPSQAGGNAKKNQCPQGSFSEASSSSGIKRHFLDMGFSEDMVERAIKLNGDGNADVVLETLLTYSSLNAPDDDYLATVHSPHVSQSPEVEDDTLDDETDTEKDDFDKEFAEDVESISENDKKRLQLLEMDFPIDEINLALERCGEKASISELADSIYASQMHNAADQFSVESSTYVSSYFPGQDEDLIDVGDDFSRCDRGMDWVGECSSGGKRKRKHVAVEKNTYSKRYKNSHLQRDFNDESETVVWMPSSMVGFGLPRDPNIITYRKIPDGAVGPPYFYYENVALTPKGVWETISRFLYDVQPEFVDSQYFSASARKRGYIHNLPIDGRFQLQPIPPLTVQEALPYTKKWWPSWDPRTKLNCIQTCTASAKLTERLRDIVAGSQGTPSYFDQRTVLEQCRKWNLVWVGLHKLAPLEPDEIEPLLGFPKYHTRGGGVSRTERLKALGNSFQVDTVAYQLSVLKKMFPNGLNVLSLFSGIGGAEVALHRLGIPLKNVVSVEISPVSRSILNNWWNETGQRGMLFEIEDVQHLTNDKLEGMISTFGGFDLIIGGSPCNNLTGSNRISRDGLEGKHSTLFYDYFRILDMVRCIMSKNR